MPKLHILCLSVTLMGLLLLAACGGSGSTLAVADSNAAPEVTTTPSGDGWDGLPSIPLDTGEAARGVSELPPGIGQVTVSGADYLQMAHGRVEGDALILESGASDPATQDPASMAYGLYKLEGLQGKRPLSLNIECVPGGLQSGYFVGIADYTVNAWRWFGPVNLPEFELDLKDHPQQLVTHLGNVYFILVCPPGTSATHFQTTAIYGDALPGDLPGFPHHLVASDGQFPEAVKLTWVPGGNAGGYEVFRRAANPESQWELIGTANEPNYLDAPLRDYKLFFYRVRAINPNGGSALSNVDSGFAGGGEDPYAIRVQIDLAGQPLANIKVGLVGLGEEMLRKTNENGIAWFNDLPRGQYIVAPGHPELDFVPAFHVVTCNDQLLQEVHFNAQPSAAFHRIWGLAFTMVEGEDGVPQMTPMAGVALEARLVGQPDVVFTATSGELGLYEFTELPEGVYLVTAAQAGFHFFPAVHEVVVNGTNRPDRRDFMGIAGDPPTPPAGE